MLERTHVSRSPCQLPIEGRNHFGKHKISVNPPPSPKKYVNMWLCFQVSHWWTTFETERYSKNSLQTLGLYILPILLLGVGVNLPKVNYQYSAAQYVQISIDLFLWSICVDFNWSFPKFFEVRLVFPTLEDQALAKVKYIRCIFYSKLLMFIFN